MRRSGPKPWSKCMSSPGAFQFGTFFYDEVTDSIRLWPYGHNRLYCNVDFLLLSTHLGPICLRLFMSNILPHYFCLTELPRFMFGQSLSIQTCKVSSLIGVLPLVGNGWTSQSDSTISWLLHKAQFTSIMPLWHSTKVVCCACCGQCF